MKLYGTAPSHFTRKVRVVLQELGHPFDFVAMEIKQLGETGQENFAGNPLLKIPVLEDEGHRFIESDLICEYLLSRYGQNSKLRLIPSGDTPLHRQRLAIMNGGMAAGVSLIRAQRSGIVGEFMFLRQERAALDGALRWLNQDLGAKNYYGHTEELSLLEITLMSFCQWAIFREMISSLSEFSNLERFVAHHKDRPSFSSTFPSMPVNP